MLCMVAMGPPTEGLAYASCDSNSDRRVCVGDIQYRHLSVIRPIRGSFHVAYVFCKRPLWRVERWNGRRWEPIPGTIFPTREAAVASAKQLATTRHTPYIEARDNG